MSDIEPKNNLRGKRMPKEIKEKIPQLVNDVAKMLGENLSKKDIAKELSKKIPSNHVTINFVNKLVIDANKKATSQINRSMSYVFNLHVRRYEKIYQDCMDDISDWRTRLEFKGRHFKFIRSKILIGLKAMKAKEELLGMHSNAMEVNISSDSVSMKRKRSHKEGLIPYRVDNLSHDEKKELLKLIQKTKISPVEGVHPLIFKKVDFEAVKVLNVRGVGSTNTQDISFEELPPDKVSQFIKKESVEEEPVTKVPAKNLDEVLSKLNSSDMDVFKNFLKLGNDE